MTGTDRVHDTLQQLTAYRAKTAQLGNLREPARTELRRSMNKERNQAVKRLTEQTLLNTLNATDTRHEELVWFWFNHFNVFWQKGLVGAALPDYLKRAIEPHVTGQFADLLLATLKHPAMLTYLDNTANVAGKLNENYARELMELHTLGVSGGYTQADVREVAHMLAGCGLRPLTKDPEMPVRLQAFLYVDGAFMFDPRRHEFALRKPLGMEIKDKGYAGVQALVNLLATHPATAKHIVGKLAVYLLGDTPPAAAVQAAEKVFSSTRGHLGKTTDSLRGHAANLHDQPRSFKAPYRYVVSSLRLLGTGMRFKNAQPVGRWVSGLGQPLFGRRTPDGYSLVGADWLSAGQLTQRFDLAREMVETTPRLLERPVDARTVLASAAAQKLMSRLGATTLTTLRKSEDDPTRLALLLSSPEFMYD